MKKILTFALVAAMLTATGMTAFAAPITQETSDNGNTTVTYQVDPTYTITIPDQVELSKTDTVEKEITAEDLLLPHGQKVVVKLSAASNTASGGTFHAKNGDSDATYTITANNKAIALGDEVASFTENGSQPFTFSQADMTNVIFSGKHTETLTFTVSLADAEGEKTLAEQVTTNGSVVHINFDFTAGGETNAIYVEYTYNNGTFTRTGQTESFSPSGTWTVTESSGVLTFKAYYDPGFGESVLDYSSTINLNDLTYNESNTPTSENPRWTMTLNGIDVNDTPVAITQNG